MFTFSAAITPVVLIISLLLISACLNEWKMVFEHNPRQIWIPALQFLSILVALIILNLYLHLNLLGIYIH